MKGPVSSIVAAWLAVAAAPGVALAAEPARWTLVVPPGQPIRIQRALVERTPDASQSPQFQVQQGVNPWVQLLVYAVAQVASNKMERSSKADQEEIVVPTDAAVGAGTIALADTATQKTYETQDDANRVIRPYAEALSGTALHDLLAGAAPLLATHGVQLAAGGAAGAVPPERALQLAPRFVFSLDQRSVSVDALVGRPPPPGQDGSAAAPADAATAAGVLRVKVHTAAADAFDIGDHWLRDGARTLRGTFTALLVSALEIAAPRLGQPPAAPAAGARQRTFRFRLGSENLFVRGHLVQASCEQVLVDSIEGHLVAAPAAALRDKELLPADCPRG